MPLADSPVPDSQLLLFAVGPGAAALGQGVAGQLGVALSAHEDRGFEDGERKTRPLVNVRGRDVYVLAGLHRHGSESVHDALCRLLFFTGALVDASAARVTAVVPYLCYARKDRRSKPRDPLGSRYVAQLLESMGVARVITIDVHNPAAYQNAFRIPAEHLEAVPLFLAFLREQLGDAPAAVVSPDAGGVKRAERLRERLQRAQGRACPLIFVEKHRSEGVMKVGAVVGDVAGRQAVLVDDLISSGSTLVRAAQALRRQGATRVLALATHAVFAPGAAETLGAPDLDRVVVTSTLPVPPPAPGSALAGKLVVLDVAPLVAAAIARVHAGGSLVELMEG